MSSSTSRAKPAPRRPSPTRRRGLADDLESSGLEQCTGIPTKALVIVDDQDRSRHTANRRTKRPPPHRGQPWTAAAADSRARPDVRYDGGIDVPGATQPEGHRHGERREAAMGLRTLTILFTDVVGSTELLGGLAGPEAVRLRAEHFAVLRRQIRRHGGREVKNLGDGLMVAFEAAGEALDCAVAMQKGCVEEVGRPARAISIRIGISSGDVHEQEGDCFGGPVVEANRLCARARGGQVLVAEATRSMTRGNEGLVEVGDLKLKGLAEPLRAWEAHWSAEALPLIRVVLADDAVLVREGIAQVLESSGLEVVAQAGDAEELLRLTAELPPTWQSLTCRMPPTQRSRAHRGGGADSQRASRYRGARRLPGHSAALRGAASRRECDGHRLHVKSVSPTSASSLRRRAGLPREARHSRRI